MNKTIFCDNDCTLLKHYGGLHPIFISQPLALPNVHKCIAAWKDKDYTIVLTTGRPESMRDMTVQQLAYAGIFYDKLITGLPRGPRVIINDTKPDCDVTATAINIPRNQGFSQEHFEI